MRGFTLVELLMVIAIIGIITPVLVTLLSIVTQGFTGYEAQMQLRKTNQKALNRVYLRLSSCKRIFTNSDTAFLNKVSLTGCPALLTGSKLPVIDGSGTLTVGTTNFTAACVGNSLLFANNESSEVLNGTDTVRVDSFRFNYYYLTAVNPKSIYDKESYVLMEWRSVKYADANQLITMGNTAKRINVIKDLYNKGIIYAWDPSAASAAQAFYNLSPAGSFAVSGSHSITRYKCESLTAMTTGVVFGGYRYGVSANSSGWAKAPKTVPVYGLASAKFPGGFEAAVVGSSAGRQVLVRSVLVAQGSMRGIMGDDMQIVCSARDLW